MVPIQRSCDDTTAAGRDAQGPVNTAVSCATNCPPLDGSILPAKEVTEPPTNPEDDPVWLAYVRQQQRLSCPGCGEGGPVY